MEIVRYIAIELGVTSSTVFVFFNILLGIFTLVIVGIITMWLVRRWTTKKLEHYRVVGMNVQVSPFMIEEFIWRVSACAYGLVLTFPAAIMLIHKIQSIGWHPQAPILWIVGASFGTIMLLWIVINGYTAYRIWRDSILPLESENLSITDT